MAHAMPFAPQLDQLLEMAVAENTCAPNGGNPHGILWRRINARVLNGDYGEELRARVSSPASKVLAKRWYLLHH